MFNKLLLVFCFAEKMDDKKTGQENNKVRGVFNKLLLVLCFVEKMDDKKTGQENQD